VAGHEDAVGGSDQRGHGEENQLSGSVILGQQVLLITTEALFSAAVGQALDALAQVVNHQAGCLQAITTLLKFCHHHGVEQNGHASTLTTLGAD